VEPWRWSEAASCLEAGAVWSVCGGLEVKRAGTGRGKAGKPHRAGLQEGGRRRAGAWDAGSDGLSG
jgi:hypothetical protein